MIHKTAIIDKNVKIGKNVSIGPFSIIHKNVLIGEGTKIFSSVEIYKNTILGKNCEIHKGVVIGDFPQIAGYEEEEGTKVIIGDNNIIREYVTIHRGSLNENGETVLGNNNLIMGLVHIAHDCYLQNNIIIANETALSGHVKVEDNVFISGLCPIHQFVTIGRNSFIAGGYRVDKDVIPFSSVAGDPISITGLNITGLKRAGFKRETLKELKKAFKILSSKEIILFDKKVEEIEKNCLDLPEIKYLINYLKEDHNRGIILKFGRIKK